MTTPHGLLVVDKPRGPTSHDVVAQGRRLFHTRAVGHAGTLDPMASGVLLLLVGEGTKLVPYLTLEDKEYLATVSFGRATDTLDAEGQTTDEAPVPDGALAPHRVEAALAAERTRLEQIPPAYSAISVDGVRAHRLARRGGAPELAPRPVAVRSIRVRETGGVDVVVELCVSKGYYVRSFARDLGAQLGLPAHLSALRRLASGPFRIEDAVPWPQPSPPELTPLVVAARRVMPSAVLTTEGALRARQGKLLAPDHFAAPPPEGPGPTAWLSEDERLVAVGALEQDGARRVLRGFNDRGTSPESS